VEGEGEGEGEQGVFGDLPQAGRRGLPSIGACAAGGCPPRTGLLGPARCHANGGSAAFDAAQSGLLWLGQSFLAAFPPFGAVFDDPIREGALKTDIVARLLGLDPLVLENLLPFGLKLAVKR